VILVADTSGLIAAFNTADPEHKAAAEALSSAGFVIVSPLALGEIDHVVTARVSRAAADRVLEQVRARVEVKRAQLAEIDVRLLGVALSVRRRYQDMDLDLADAVNVALAARYETATLLTLDRRDFRALLPLSRHRAFRLLPDDQ
jgi:uncharacterized protein